MRSEIKRLVCLLLLLGTVVVAGDKKDGTAEETADGKTPVKKSDDVSDTDSDKPPSRDPNQGFVRLSPKEKIWVHPGKKWIVVDGRVCLREGQLEMFAVPYETKTHEAVVSINEDFQQGTP
mgnify:FL=1